MKQFLTSFGLVALAVVASQAVAQPLPPPPATGPAPLFYVRFLAPVGMQVTFYQGHAAPRTLAAPVTVAVRPGYAYRVKLSEIPGYPGISLCPTLEVFGTLQLPPNMRGIDYPAPVAFSDVDVRLASASAFLTKVVYLEDPNKAVPVATVPGEPPLEGEVPATRDPWIEARELGRPLAMVRMGGRHLEDDELIATSVPGTILFPGQQVLGPPAAPPWMPWNCIPFHDPRLGPKPGAEECLHDGGDGGIPAGLDRNGHVQGLDPADTVAEYTDGAGHRHLAISNRVCLCVPRFAVLRKEQPLARFDTALAPGGIGTVQAQTQMKARVPSRTMQQNEQLGGLLGQVRPSGAVNAEAVGGLIRVEVLQGYFLDLGPAAAIGTAWAQQLTELEITRLVRQMELAQSLSQSAGVQGVRQIEGTAVVGKIEKLDVVGTVIETRDFTACCHDVPKVLPDKPLILCKWVDAQAAKVGDVVTFYLKYSNLGGRPITEVAVSDSLTGRLEYVPGSSKSDRNAVFTMQPNEAGSLILRWDVSGALQPGQSGVVSFQARVR